MKNLVKSCKRKLWRAYFFGILSAAIMFLGFYLAVNDSSKNNTGLISL